MLTRKERRRRAFLRGAFDGVVFDGESVLGKEGYCFGVGDAFLLEDAGGECVGGVVVEDVAGALGDDGAGVVFVGAEVDGAAGDFAAGVEDGFVDVMSPHALSAEGREECGVDVHHAVFVVGGDVPEAEPAGLNDEIDAGGVQCLGQFCAEGFDIGKVFAADDGRFEAEFTGAVTAGDLGAGADDGDDFGVEAAGGDFVLEVDHGASAAAEENAKAKFFAGWLCGCGGAVDVGFGVHGQIGEGVGVGVFFAADVGDPPDGKAAEDFHASLVEGANVFAFDFVAAVELLDEEVAVAVELDFGCAEGLGVAEGFSDGGVFGVIIGDFAEIDAAGGQACAGGVVDGIACGSRAGIAATAAVGIDNDLLIAHRLCP